MLLWTFQLVDVCPHHGRLRDVCPRCGERQPVLTSLSRPGYCARCFQWLGEPARMPDRDDTVELSADAEWLLWVARVVGDILASATPCRPWPERGRVALVLTRHVDVVGAGEASKLARRVGVTREALRRWKTGISVPQLGCLLRLCYHLDITPLAMVTEDDGARSLLPVTPGPRCAAPLCAKRRKRRILDVEDIKVRMQATVDANEQPPPSLACVARRFDVAPKQLRNHCVAQSRVIIERYVAYRRCKKGERTARIQMAVFDAVADAVAEGAPLSKEAVFARVPKGVLQLNPIARHAYSDALERVGADAGPP